MAITPPNHITVEVAYAKSPTEQTVLTVTVPKECTVNAAICQSEIVKTYPDIDLTKCKVGIFSRLVSLQQIVCDGDRIEIYRSLQIDPKAARRQRALVRGKQ